MTLDLLVPALAGYLFLRLCNFTRFGLLRESGYHVAFGSAIVGLMLYALGLGAVEWRWVEHSSWLEIILEGAEAHLDARPAVSWSLILGAALPWLANAVYWPGRADRAAARRVGDFVALVLDEAMRTGKSVEVSLHGGKTYIGFVMSRPGVSQEAFRLVPLVSGYRDTDTQRLVLTTDYSKILAVTPAREWSAVAIPRANVRWARFFNIHPPYIMPPHGESESEEAG